MRLARDARGYEVQFATSHLGHFQLTRALPRRSALPPPRASSPWSRVRSGSSSAAMRRAASRPSMPGIRMSARRELPAATRLGGSSKDSCVRRPVLHRGRRLLRTARGKRRPLGSCCRRWTAYRRSRSYELLLRGSPENHPAVSLPLGRGGEPPAAGMGLDTGRHADVSQRVRAPGNIRCACGGSGGGADFFQGVDVHPGRLVVVGACSEACSGGTSSAHGGRCRSARVGHRRL